MPKQKTHKGLSKRVTVTATGKINRKRCGGGHLMSSKNAKRRRRIKSPAIIAGKAADKIRLFLNK
ncbi:MAG: 50S ribosomal protein L35 [Sedimentisphaerales bacterium]|nr:50S ribosomal protein L35 [Sedimentisphaerales bacterium]